MSDLLALAAPYLPGEVSAAAIYKSTGGPHDDLLTGVCGAFLLGVVELAVRALIRHYRALQQGLGPAKAIQSGANVLVAIGGENVTIVIVKSTMGGWVAHRIIGTIPMAVITARPLKREAFGLELSWPAGDAQLRPLYRTDDTELIARTLLDRAP
jgi:hypothetical protein